ncbi:MAG: hypothetical protein IGBAC_0657 [Ignavibacteriae bacterium]|nr:MAG: hypothetical protein IGBAC_0657 [Ignavibacteriota bacterium]
MQKKITFNQDMEYSESIRFHSIRQQIYELSDRALLIRNAIFFEILAVLFFVLACLLIGIYFVFENPITQILPLISFLLGMISVFTGLIFFGIEILRAYKVVQLEIIAEE